MIQLYHLKSYVTNTRLMGVIAIKSYIEDHTGSKFILISILDFETDGYDDIHVISMEDDEAASDRIYGGLGGELFEISYKEASFLINQAREIGMNNIDKDLEKFTYFYDESISLTEVQINNLYKIISVKYKEEYETINYYLMRVVGNDSNMSKWIYNGIIDFEYLHDSTLIKNTITDDSENMFVSNALILVNNSYFNDRFLFTMNQNKILVVKFLSRLKISHYEAALQLKSKEYIQVFHLEDIEGAFTLLADGLKNIMIGNYNRGILFTIFNKNNNHVKKQIYYLNGDVKAHLFLTDMNQVIISSNDEKKLLDAKKDVISILSNRKIELLKTIEFTHQVLFDFIKGNYGDFIEFMSEVIE